MNLWVSMEDEGLAPLRTRAPSAGAWRRSPGISPSWERRVPRSHPHSPLRFEDQARVLLDA